MCIRINILVYYTSYSTQLNREWDSGFGFNVLISSEIQLEIRIDIENVRHSWKERALKRESRADGVCIVILVRVSEAH